MLPFLLLFFFFFLLLMLKIVCAVFFWFCVFGSTQLLLSIQSLLTDPNTRDPLRPDAAKLYDTNRRQYNKTAAEWTAKYAM